MRMLKLKKCRRKQAFQTENHEFPFLLSLFATSHNYLHRAPALVISTEGTTSEVIPCGFNFVSTTSHLARLCYGGTLFIIFKTSQHQWC